MNNTIQHGSHVSLQYKLSVDGAIIEDSRKSFPLKYIHGKGKLLQGFINRLEGLKAGDERNFEIPPKEAHGLNSDSRIQEVARSELPVGIEPKVGMTLKWKNKKGDLRPFKVTKVNQNSIMLNNNHPMAGKGLVLQVEILTVE